MKYGPLAIFLLFLTQQNTLPLLANHSSQYKMAATGPQHQVASAHLDQQHAVTLSLGPAKHEMLVDANHLACRSNFFKTVLRTKWPEGQPRIVPLPDIDYQKMASYLQFVNVGSLPTTNAVSAWTAMGLLGAEIRYINLAKLYVLGQRLVDGALVTAVVLEIVRISTVFNAAADGSMPGYRTINIIYAGTSPNAPARRLLVDVYTRFGQARHLDALNGIYHADFMRDLAQELLAKAASNKAPGSYRLQSLNAAHYIV